MQCDGTTRQPSRLDRTRPSDAAARRRGSARGVRTGGDLVRARPERQQGLGRGLAALIPQRNGGQAGSLEIPIDRVEPNPFQPRKRFDPDSLATLTESIVAHGVIQPILVTETIDGYQLVAGERRLRAAEAAGLERVPAVVR